MRKLKAFKKISPINTFLKKSSLEVIQESGLFDENWYRERHNIKEEGFEAALQHYLNVGWKNGDRPHPLFEVEWYVSQHAEICQLKISPLEHYARIAMPRGDSPHPLFETNWYQKQYKQALLKKEDAFLHFLRKGAMEGISPHPLFDGKYYLQQDQSIAYSGVNPLTHFVEVGYVEGKNPNPYFNSSWYLKQYNEVYSSKKNPLVHFITEGARLGHLPHPDIDIKDIISDKKEIPKDPLRAFVYLVTHEEDLLKARLSQRIRNSKISQVSIDKPVRPFVPQSAWDINGYSNGSDDESRLTTFEEKMDIQFNTKNISLNTVDIWDTILRRDCQPDEIKVQSARYLLLRAYHNLRPAYRNIRALFAARLFAENTSAPNDEHEYQFVTAVTEWLRLTLVAGCASKKIDSLLKELYQHEFMSEVRSTRVDKNLVSALKKTKAPIVFASDFYMPSGFMTDLLQEKAVGIPFIKGYVSSDEFCTKRSGKMFDKILTDFSEKPENILHIGDNSWADVKIPSSKGICTHLFEIPAESKRKAWYDEAASAWHKGDDSVHQRRIARLLEDVAQSNEGSSNPYRAIGARLAPLALGYVLSIIEDAIQNNVNKVYYFTREGFFFKKIHDAIAEENPYNISMPSSKILFVSRRATFAASLGDCTLHNMMRLWTLYSSQSVRGLAQSLNLSVDIVSSIARKYGLSENDIIQYPWQDSNFRRFFESTEFQVYANENIRTQKELLRKYLLQEGYAKESLAIVSDIGWRGTIQDNLSHIEPSVFSRGHYIGLFGYLNNQPANSYKAGWLFDINRGLSGTLSEVAPFEMLFNGPGGSVVNYEEVNGYVKPVTEIHREEEAIITGPVHSIQEGLLDAVKPLADYIRLHGLTSAELQPLALKIAASLSDSPPVEVADTFQQLHHNESFGTGQIEKMSALTKLKKSLGEKSSSEINYGVRVAINSARWPASLLKSTAVEKLWKDTSPYRRLSLPADMNGVYAPNLIKARGTSLSIFAPSPIRNSGGHRTIFNVARALERAGFNLHIFLEGIGSGVESVEEYLAGTPAVIHTEWHKHIPSEAALATIAHSAHFVSELDGPSFRGYLVQDFEALFNPMSDGYVLAENSYGYGLNHMTIGNWLSHVIMNQYSGISTPAGLGVDTSIYKKKVGSERHPSVCFLYQPDKPRRTPRLGIDALRLVKRARPDVKITLFGSDLPVGLDFEVENRGVISNLAELNELYQTTSVGLCVSGSNPSRIPYEMMAAGCVPVDIYRYNNLLDHEVGTILLAYQDPASIAQAILKLLDDEALLGQMSDKAAKFTLSRTLDWEQDVIVNNTIAAMQNEGHIQPRFELFYDAEPIIAKSGNTMGAEQFCAFQAAQARQNSGRC